MADGSVSVGLFACHQHAYALELLQDHLKEGMRALDVGSGSGYLAVCMAEMVNEICAGKIALPTE